MNDLARIGFECDAIEFSSAARAVARQINRYNKHGHIYDEKQAAWCDAFDYVMAFEVLEHIEDDAGALAEWRSFLKPKGRLLISVPAHQSRWNASDLWAGHVRRYDREDIKNVIRLSGFEIERIECYGFPLTNIIEPIRASYHNKQLNNQGQAGSADLQRRKHTERSGVERSLAARLFPWMNAIGGRAIMRVFFHPHSAALGCGGGDMVIAWRQE